MRIAIFLMNRIIGSEIHGLVDSMIATNYALHKSGMNPMFEWDTVSVDGSVITPTNGIKIQPDFSLDRYQGLDTKPDAWIFPSVFQSSTDYSKVERAMNQARPMVPVIKQHFDQGGLLLSICSGSFLLAEAGLMQDRPALMHWLSEASFRRMFPRLKIDTRNSVADYGNIICAIGGSMAYEYLIMHLVERFAGHRTAVDTAKLLMINLIAPSPRPFRTSIDAWDHSDDLVLRAQRFIDKHSAGELNIGAISEDLAISERQLNRRFVKALQCSPVQYLQKTRVNRACSLLELTQLPSSKIVYEVGYQDESSFRRMFKKQMEMTMESYRRRFGGHRPQLV